MVIVEHCSKSVLTFSSGGTFCPKKFNYYLLYLPMWFVYISYNNDVINDVTIKIYGM